MGNIQYYSFDIFDTCLVRACGRPEFVFDILAGRVLGESANMTQRMDFAYIRRKAESIAINKYVLNEIEDVTLDEIYEECDFTSLTTVCLEEIKAVELNIERELLFPVLETKKIIEKLRNEKQRILFISDMYLPSCFIRDILAGYGLLKDGDGLYVSSDCRKKKSTGSLFKYVSKKENIRFEKWIHYGDNQVSDVKIPKSLGIKSRKINHSWSFYERMLSLQDMTSSRFDLKIIASLSKTLRLINNISPEAYFASDFIAPLYVPFVYYILSEAEKKGIESVYFLARDGYIFYKIALRLNKRFPALSLHYLYVSRKSLYLPGLDDLSLNSLKELFFEWDECLLNDVLDRFQMDLGVLTQDYSSLRGEELLASLLKDNGFVENLRKKRDEQRNYCIDYFTSEGLTNGAVAIVDLSGSRKCSISINHILNSYGYPSVYGFYFDVLKEHIVDDKYLSTFFSGRYGFNYMNIRKEPQMVFEQYFSVSPHDRTVSYCKSNGHVMPVFEKEITYGLNRNQVFELNRSICEQFADLYMLLFDKPDSYKILSSALHIYTIFYYAPDPFFLKALEGVYESNSVDAISFLLEKQSIWGFFMKRKRGWFYGNCIFNTCFKSIVFKFLVLFYFIRKWKKSKELL